MNLEYNRRGILNAYFRQQRKFIITFALILVLGIVHIITAKRVYEADGSFLVKFGEDARPNVNMAADHPADGASSDERTEVIQSNVSIAQSQSLIHEVVADLGAEKIYPGITSEVKGKDTPDDAAVKRLLMGDLDVKSVQGADIIGVRVYNANPAVAAQLTNDLMTRFITRQSQVYDTPQTNFLQQQVQDAKTRLDQSQQQFQDFKKDVGVSAIDSEMDQLRKEKSDLNSLAYQSVTDAEKQLAESQSKASEVESTYRPDSPIYQRAEDSVHVAKQALAARQADLRATASTSTSLGQKISAIDARMKFLEIQRGQFNDLQQRVAMDEDNYKYYQQRSEEARANSLLDQQKITRIAIVDKAEVPARPVKPRKLFLLLLSLFGGLVVGLGFALLSELADDRLTTPEQVTASLSVPVLAAFPRKGQETLI